MERINLVFLYLKINAGASIFPSTQGHYATIDEETTFACAVNKSRAANVAYLDGNLGINPSSDFV